MLIVARPNPGGGIGNYLFHLCHSIMYAQLEKATLVIPRPLAFRTMNNCAITFDFSVDRKSYDTERIEVLDYFIHGNEATRRLSFKHRYDCMQEHIKPLFEPNAKHEPLGEETLAIHVRSGDIFQPDGSNTKYGQPPLSWYEMLIERCGYKDIVIVTQTKFHNGGPSPVIPEIKRRWPHVPILSDDVEVDFHTLRNARHLALSGSTFAVTAAMLNTRLHQLHLPLYDRPADPNFTHVFPAGVDLGFTRSDYKIRNYEGMREWRHLPEQIQLMLEHSIDDIDVQQEFGGSRKPESEEMYDGRRQNVLGWGKEQHKDSQEATLEAQDPQPHRKQSQRHVDSQSMERQMNDQSDEVTRYYLEERDDFFGNAPLEHLMEVLSKRITARTDKRFVLAVDVGCCVGGFIERILSVCPESNGLLLGVEPNPLNVEQLRGRSFSRPVEFVECALSDAEGTATLSTISDHPENRAGYSLASLNGDGERIVGVPVITFDQLLKRSGLSNTVIRFVKIDCEGLDTKVLRGMRNSLASIEYLVFESSDCLDDRRGPQEKAPLEQIVQFLDDHGFDTYKVGHRRLLQQNDDAWRDCFERVKFHSNSFSLRKEDPMIHTLVDTDGFFRNP